MDDLLHPVTSPGPSSCYTSYMLTTMVTRQLHTSVTTAIDVYRPCTNEVVNTEMTRTLKSIGTNYLLRPNWVLMQLWTQTCYGRCLDPGTRPTLFPRTVLHLVPLSLCRWVPVVPVSVPWLIGISGWTLVVRVRPTPGAGWFPPLEGLVVPPGVRLIGIRVLLPPPNGPYATSRGHGDA